MTLPRRLGRRCDHTVRSPLPFEGRCCALFHGAGSWAATADVRRWRGGREMRRPHRRGRSPRRRVSRSRNMRLNGGTFPSVPSRYCSWDRSLHGAMASSAPRLEKLPSPRAPPRSPQQASCPRHRTSLSRRPRDIRASRWPTSTESRSRTTILTTTPSASVYKRAGASKSRAAGSQATSSTGPPTSLRNNEVGHSRHHTTGQDSP